MTTARQLLQEASDSRLEGFCPKTEKFLGATNRDDLGHKEAKLYSDFIQNCLRIFATELKQLTEPNEVDEISRTAVVCGRGYTKLLPCLDEDKKLGVPSLLFSVMQNVHDKTTADNTVALAETAYNVMCAVPVNSETATTIVTAFHGHLWNKSCKLLKQGSSATLKNVLQYRKFSLLFACLIPSKQDSLTQLLRVVLSHFAQFNKDFIDHGTASAFLDIFDSVTTKLIALRNCCSKKEEKITLTSLIVRINSMLVEHVARAGNFAQVLEILAKMKALETDNDLSALVSDIYACALELIKMGKSLKKNQLDSKQVEDTLLKVREHLSRDRCEYFLVLFNAVSYVVTQISYKLIDGWSKDLIRVLCETCKVQRALFEKLVKVRSAATIEKEVTDQERKKAEEWTKLVGILLLGYHRHGQLLQKLVEKDISKDLVLELVDVTKNWQTCLNGKGCCLQDKNIRSHRENIVYICSSVGSQCIKRQMYEEASELYTVVIRQSRKTGQTNILGFYDELIHCYIQLRKWTEGSKVIVQALASVDDSLKPAASLWIRLKKEALAQNPMFQSITLRAIVEKSGVTLSDISPRQLLLAEYRALKNLSRRLFGAEYHVLQELMDTSQDDVQKAEVMVALAVNLSVTCKTVEERSASELLNQAIVMLDKAMENCDATLAVANYIKYVILHEEAIEHMKSETGQIDYFGKSDVSESSRFTLSQEQENLSFLVRAIELWEASLGENEPDVGKKTKKATKRESKQSSDFETDRCLFDLKHHVDNLIMCGSRLIAMKQPHLAVRALKVAKHQLANISDSRQLLELSVALCRSLMLLGKFDEAEAVMDGKGDNQGKSSPTQVLLLLAELYMMLGKKDASLEILKSVLDSTDLQGKTVKVYQLHGTAKRLMSMGLCLPSNGHMISSTNQYLLTLAFEAVHSHVTVINFYTKDNMLEKNTDKWLILNEVLSSLLHVCKLYRFVGLPRDALCYLKAGLNISQGQGLPRWSCEFLFELLGLQTMEGDCNKALGTIEYISSVLGAENQSTKCNSRNQSKAKNRTREKSAEAANDNSNIEDQRSEKVKDDSEPSEADDAFGFENLSLTPVPKNKEKIETDTSNTPERVYVQESLDSEKKNKIEQLKHPECVCMKERSDRCSDMVRHKLCLKAGIVLADFLAQTDMKKSADRMLTEIEASDKILSSFVNSPSDLSKTAAVENSGRNGVFILSDVFKQDPGLLYICLQAGCIKAETYLYQKDVHRVHQIWKTFHSLEQNGSLNNVLHSNILLTRLALCDATGYMLSLHGDRHELLKSENHFETGISADQLSLAKEKDTLSKKLENLTIKPKKKVSIETNDLSVTGTGIKKKKLFNEVTTPMNSALKTPKVPKRKITLTTPAASKKDMLEYLIMDSDEEAENSIVFPAPKPVTPKVGLKSVKKCRNKTEPRSIIKKPSFTVLEDPVPEKDIACKLSFAFDSDSPINSDDKKLSKTEKPKKSRSKGKKDSGANKTVAGDQSEKKSKSNVSSRSKKTAAVHDTSVDSFADTVENKTVSEKEASKNDREILKEKAVIENKEEGEPQNHVDRFKGDVFDFDTETSPGISKVTKTGKGKGSKTVSKVKKAENVKKRSKDSEQNENNDTENVEMIEETKVKTKTVVRKGRPKRKVDNDVVEKVRIASTSDSECKDFDLSMDDVTAEDDVSDEIETKTSGFKIGVALPEPLSVSIDQSDLGVDDITVESVDITDLLEEKEIMRGDTKPKTTRKTTRGRKTAPKNDSEENKPKDTEKEENRGGGRKESRRQRTEIKDTSVNGNESENSETEGDEKVHGIEGGTCGTTEQMRSGRVAKLTDLTDHLGLMDGPSPTVDAGLSGARSPSSDIIPTLESLYHRLSQFPPSPQHSDVCHMLALHYLESDSRRAAFYLTDAMAVTFRHQVMLNACQKARREAKEKGLSARTACVETNMFTTEDEKFQQMINTVPEDWCVVQLSVVSAGLPWKQMILTRFVRNHPPIVLKLRGFSSPQGRCILKDFSSIMEKNAETAKIESTSEWWSARYKLDSDMKELVERMEKHWLAFSRCAMLPGGYPEKVLVDVRIEIQGKLKMEINFAQTELLLLAEKHLSEREFPQFVMEVLGCSESAVEDVTSVVKKFSKSGAAESDKQHTVLILDKTVQHLPWESIPILSDKSVTRMPCLSHLAEQVTSHQNRETSVVVKGVNSRNTYYILNPDSNLPRTEEFFKDWFQSEKYWKGVIGRAPSSAEFVDALTKKDLLIYCGHGSGGRFFNSDEIEKLTAQAVTVLMGCSSGRLLVKGQLEPAGMMMSYFLAGCPTMVANLWDITDKDIDKFSEEFIKSWLESSHGTYLPQQVQKARSKCKLKYMNGLAPVVYGLPVFINQQKSGLSK